MPMPCKYIRRRARSHGYQWLPPPPLFCLSSLGPEPIFSPLLESYCIWLMVGRCCVTHEYRVWVRESVFLLSIALAEPRNAFRVCRRQRASISVHGLNSGIITLTSTESGVARRLKEGPCTRHYVVTLSCSCRRRSCIVVPDP